MLAAVPAAGDEDPPEPRQSFEQQDLTVLVSLKDSLVPSPSPALPQPLSPSAEGESPAAPGGDAQCGLSAFCTKTTGLVLSCAVWHSDRDFRGRLCWGQGAGYPPQTQKGSSQCLGDTSTTWQPRGLAICRAHEDNRDGCFRNGSGVDTS